jgi:rhamnulokinase
MSEAKYYIAVDLGASSGRVIIGSADGEKIFLEEVHRFENGPIENEGSLQWDFAKIFREVETGLAKAVKRTGGKIESIGVDSWGVDFGLLDSKGHLLENPYHYRDKRTDTMMDSVFSSVPRENVYDITGIQFMQFNTIYQLQALKLKRPEILKKTNKLVFMADLVSYFLCDALFGEYTLASTSQLMDMKKGIWSQELFNALSLPMNIMPPIVKPGTIVGRVKKQIAEKIRSTAIPIVAVGSHDTASAVASVPAQTGSKWAYLSSGTWSLMGIEIPETLINDDTYKYQFTNEGGINNTIRLLKNIMGLWLIQECRRVWNKQGSKFSFSDLTMMAQKAKPFVAVIDPNDSRFLSQCDMPSVINEYLVEHGYAKINDPGQMIRVIVESLAFYYRRALEILENITDSKIEVLHLVGGGIQNEMLNQFTADSIGRKVIAGPVEATAMGNIVVQAITSGQIEDIAHGRRVIENSIPLKIYQPAEHKIWNEKYQQIKSIFGL